MKQILFRKYMDIAGQALMLLPLVLIASPEKENLAVFTYFTVGGWQIISCLLSAISGKRPGNDRRTYSKALAWLLGIFVACLLISFLGQFCHRPGQQINVQGINGKAIGDFFGGIALWEAALMLISGPFMAIWYARITICEIQELRNAIHHRSEVHWKL